LIKVSVLYSNGSGARFDMDYYCGQHIPLVQRLLGTALKGTAVDGGMAGATTGSAPSFLAMRHLVFDSLEDFQSAFGPHAKEIYADVENDTNIQPAIQISQIMI
jgi:uncharacterized protein (TIGR02118 family)